MPALFPPDNVFKVAKNALVPAGITCEWNNCAALLNCWQTLSKHLQHHCKYAKHENIYFCRFDKCLAQNCDSYHALWKHVESSHLSKVPLPCPSQGCLHVFHYPADFELLSSHLESSHPELLHDGASNLKSKLKHSWKPAAARTSDAHEDQRTFSGSMESHLLITPHISRGRKRPRRSPPKVERKWVHLDEAAQVGLDPKPDPDTLPFDDLPVFPSPPPSDMRTFTEFIVRRKPPEPVQQLARPQPVSEPPIRERTPPRSMGYGTFEQRVAALEQARLLDGSGVWPSRENTPT
ncbi:hypothetical protein OBBRIDRAFT_553340 [Obba rivulosa]|uniref:C2H2-type domain-containing protein n=1 Tax=Obba rivulosa TaxID=1052685 RepID=A0A8E2B3Y3_9APHY|nr:hypothetical protein OBBRIDRAFT_553340 [Obba rivulosa]